MLTIEQRIAAFVRLGQWMDSPDPALDSAIRQAGHQNAWFTEKEVRHALGQWSQLLKEDNLHSWLEPYRLLQPLRRKIGVVNAGNIPLVGFHDMLTVVLSGQDYQGKNAADDNILLPFLASKIMVWERGMADHIAFVPRLQDFDAVIATGSDNSARYFLHYFSKVPHVIRKNRNGVALLDGNETPEQMAGLADDVFRYFGLGCRNVSHLLLPANYDFSKLFESFETHVEVKNHHKYNNNYEYYRAVLTLKKITYLDNGFLIVRQEENLASPVSILHYSFYQTKEEALRRLSERKDDIQCIVSSSHLPFGSTQSPGLADYADGVDTMEFLTRSVATDYH